MLLNLNAVETSFLLHLDFECTYRQQHFHSQTFSKAHITFSGLKLRMVQLNIIYAKTENTHFDWEYYLNTHMPMSIKLHGDALKSITIAKGVEGIEAAPVAYVALTTMLFDSVEAFLGAFMPHAETLQGDIKNYTNIQPIIQFSDIVLQQGQTFSNAHTT